MGSDTTQDVLNALSGYAPAPGLSAADSRYEPAIASNGQQLLSFNALNPDPAGDTCITTKLGGPAFDRPNGSGNGREALSRAEDGTGWGTAACTGAGVADVGGQIDFARSSSGPASGDTGTDLTYSVLGRDAVSIAFYRTGVAGNTIDPVTSTSSQLKTRWTRNEITALFSNATGAAQPFLADDGVTTVNVLACGIQTGSGTFSFTRGVYGVTTGQEATATSVCTPTRRLTTPGERLDRLEGQGRCRSCRHPGRGRLLGWRLHRQVERCCVPEPAARRSRPRRDRRR